MMIHYFVAGLWVILAGNRSLRLLFIVAAHSVIGLSGLAAEEPPARFEIQGAVTDTDQEMIVDASVTLIAAGSVRDPLSQINPTRPTLDGRTDGQGIYRVGFNADDHRFLTQGNSLLLVRARGFLATLVLLPMERLKVDVPLDIELKRAELVTVNVIDANGDPVTGALVYPASINGLRIPWVAAREFPVAVTDDSGNTKIEESTSKSLRSFFVVGDHIGHQRTEAILTEVGQLTTQTAVTRSVVGQISTSQGSGIIPDIEDVRMLVVTSSPSDRFIFESPMVCSWSMVPVAASGSFRIDSIAVGDVFYGLDCAEDFPYRENVRGRNVKIEAGQSDFRWDIQFQKQAKVTVTVSDTESGDPLPNILISGGGSRLVRTVTDEQGKASYYQNRDRVFYVPTPFDIGGDFLYLGASHQKSKKVVVNGEVELGPLSMVRSSRWRGIVVDDQGRPVPGARVDYTYSPRAGYLEDPVFTDSTGRYRLFRVADGTAVKVTARRNHSVSKTASIVLPPKDDKPLILIERPTAIPTGRIVTPDGKAMQNVPVILKRGRVLEKESFDREQLIPDELYPTPVIAWTDQSGLFRFPPTVAFGERLRVQVGCDRFFPFSSNYIDGSKISVSEDRSLDLGEFRVMQRPPSRRIMVNVRDDSGEPVAGAQVVVVGARTGSTNGTTNSSGLFSAELASGVSVVAVQAEGYRIRFSEFPIDSNSFDLTLYKFSSPANSENRPAREFDKADFERAANEIFSAIEVPVLGSSSLHRMRLYSLALSSISPVDYAKFLESHRKSPAPLMQMALVATGEAAISQRPDLLNDVVEKVMTSPLSLLMVAMIAADSSEDNEVQDEWLAEAMVAVRSLSGKRQTGSAIDMAKILLSAGKIELAKEIVAQVWSDASDLQKLVNENQRKLLIAESRTIGPALAMIDLQKAHKLIELTAREVEMSMLKSDALLIWAQANPDEFVKRLESGSIEPIDSFWSWLSENFARRKLAKVGIPKPVETSRLIDDPKIRLDFLLHHARIAPDSDLQHRLLDHAVEAIGQCKPNAARDRFATHYSKSLFRELRRMPGVHPEQLDSLLFAALQNLPQRFDSERIHTVLGGAARLLALRDRQLARTLLEPAIDERGWLFMTGLRSFHEQEALMAIGRIDPQWCVEIVNELCNEELRDNPTDQLDLRSGMVVALMSEANRR